MVYSPGVKLEAAVKLAVAPEPDSNAVEEELSRIPEGKEPIVILGTAVVFTSEAANATANVELGYTLGNSGFAQTATTGDPPEGVYGSDVICGVKCGITTVNVRVLLLYVASGT